VLHLFFVFFCLFFVFGFWWGATKPFWGFFGVVLCFFCGFFCCFFFVSFFISGFCLVFLWFFLFVFVFGSFCRKKIDLPGAALSACAELSQLGLVSRAQGTHAKSR